VSKSTNRYGQVLMSASVSIEANPQPSRKILRQQAKLDSIAKKQFGKRYDSLTGKQKDDLHLAIALRREATKRQREADVA
jgi:hypothetical protein